MPCTNCSQTTATITGFNPANCADTSAPCAVDAGCIYYTGPNLTCADIETNETLDSILQKIDPLLCSATGDYSTYNTFCLAPISTQKQFVESISELTCDLNLSYTTFTGTTFPAYMNATNTRFVAIENPSLTCTSASVTPSDTLSQILTKYCAKFGIIDNLLNISTADWNQCYVVSPLPTTPLQGFNILIDQVCLLKSQIESTTGALPTFNNIGSCLPSPLSATDSLVDTINKIKIRLCQTGTLDTTTLTWGCVTQPSGAQNLQGTIQNILTKVTQLNQAAPLQWSADFTVTNVDNSNLCLGKRIALATPSTQDRFVAATASDNTPGVLQSKMVAGTNISLDFTVPTQVTINSTGGVGTGDHKVMVDITDGTPDYLGVKIAPGGTQYGVQVLPSTDTLSETVKLNIVINPSTLFQALIDAATTNVTLKSALCQLIATCPSPCDAPSNVQVTYTGGSTTTTTTTTLP